MSSDNGQALRQAIENITTEKTVEVYRAAGGKISLDEAKLIDENLADLSALIIDMLSPDTDFMTINEKRAEVGLSPIDVRNLDTKESNESPTTDQPDAKAAEPAPAGVDDVPGSAGSGAEPDLNVVSQADLDKQLTTRLRTFKNNHHMPNIRLAKLTGVSDYTICAITNGKHVSDETRVKVLAAIDNYKPKGDRVKKPESKEYNGTGGRAAAEFIQTKLQAWLDDEDLDPASASGVMMLQEHALRSILAGHLPHINVILQLGKYIPEIKANQATLLAAVKQQEAA